MMLTEAQIIEIRDDLLPSQGEPFDCIAFARAIERQAESAAIERAATLATVRMAHNLAAEISALSKESA